MFRSDKQTYVMLNVNEGAASENVNLYKWNGDKTYDGKYLLDYV